MQQRNRPTHKKIPALALGATPAFFCQHTTNNFFTQPILE